MDNIVFKKIWEEKNLIELQILANSEFVSVSQSCYVQDTLLEQLSDKICKYIKDYSESCYLEFGQKEGNYTPAFSMYIFPAETLGHVKIEVDVEIADNNTRCHRCCFYVKSELGRIEQLGKSLKNLPRARKGDEIYLN